MARQKASAILLTVVNGNRKCNNAQRPDLSAKHQRLNNRFSTIHLIIPKNTLKQPIINLKGSMRSYPSSSRFVIIILLVVKSNESRERRQCQSDRIKERGMQRYSAHSPNHHFTGISPLRTKFSGVPSRTSASSVYTLERYERTLFYALHFLAHRC